MTALATSISCKKEIKKIILKNKKEKFTVIF